MVQVDQNTGAATANMFYYSNAAIVDGLNIMASYTPSGTAEVLSSTEFGVTYSGVEGLTVGYATGTDGGAGAASEVDNRNCLGNLCLWFSNFRLPTQTRLTQK